MSKLNSNSKQILKMLNAEKNAFDYARLEQETQKLSYSSSPFLRLVSLLFFFNINIDDFCKNQEEFLSSSEDNWETIKKKFFYDPLRYKTNHTSVKTIYSCFSQYLKKHTDILCHECLKNLILKTREYM